MNAKIKINIKNATYIAIKIISAATDVPVF